MVGRSVLAEVSALQIADIGLSSHVLWDRAKSIPLGQTISCFLISKTRAHVTLAPLHTIDDGNSNSKQQQQSQTICCISLVRIRERSVFGVRALLALLQERLTRASELLVACSGHMVEIHPPTQQQRATMGNTTIV
jgi:hypothetical protein